MGELEQVQTASGRERDAALLRQSVVFRTDGDHPRRKAVTLGHSRAGSRVDVRAAESTSVDVNR